jgi:hypothetical protein
LESILFDGRVPEVSGVCGYDSARRGWNQTGRSSFSVSSGLLSFEM